MFYSYFNKILINWSDDLGPYARLLNMGARLKILIGKYLVCFQRYVKNSHLLSDDINTWNSTLIQNLNFR